MSSHVCIRQPSSAVLASCLPAYSVFLIFISQSFSCASLPMSCVVRPGDSLVACAAFPPSIVNLSPSVARLFVIYLRRHRLQALVTEVASEHHPLRSRSVGPLLVECEAAFVSELSPSSFISANQVDVPSHVSLQSLFSIAPFILVSFLFFPFL